MAKRVPPDEKPYRPVDEELARSVLLRRKPVVVENGELKIELAPSLADEDTPLEEQAEPSPEQERLEDEPEEPSETEPVKPAAHRGRKPKKKPSQETETFQSKRKQLVREKRMLLTEQEEELFQEFVNNVSKSLGVKVNTSNILRASVALLLHAERELCKQCKRVEMKRKRPRNNEPIEIATFEENLARIFDSAIRNTKSLQ